MLEDLRNVLNNAILHNLDSQVILKLSEALDIVVVKEQEKIYKQYIRKN